MDTLGESAYRPIEMDATELTTRLTSFELFPAHLLIVHHNSFFSLFFFFFFFFTVIDA
jgi:hypothetical protein